MGENFMRLSELNMSEFEKKKASGALPTEFPTMDEKDDVHRSRTGASGCPTRSNILMTHAEYPCHSLAQTLWYPTAET